MKIFLLLLAILVASEAQVLGIDFGTEFWKASLISPGKNLVIVENSRSGRKSINGIAFHDGTRHFEDDALSKRLKKPEMSHFYLNKLLRSLDSEAPLEGYDFQNGTYYITQHEDRISLQQLTGMILKNIKLHASTQAGSEIKDAVLAIPANWGWKSKMALINAAHIADLSVLGLINENSAAAINFAITRNDSDPVNIGFFNMGSHNLQFSIIQFFGYMDEKKGKNVESLRVLSHVVEEDVGGLIVDEAIANYLADEFTKKHSVDPRSKKKSFTKLLHKASQIKEILSANKQTQAYIEGLISGIDLNLPISRQVIEEIEVFKLLNKHLDEGLEKAGISASELHSVEMIGGASRIPLITKMVKEHFNAVEVGAHINGDEAMAFGSSLRAANLSITFKVKQLHFYDGFEEEVKCQVSEVESGNVLKEEVIFTKESQHGSKFDLALVPPEQQIKVSLYYGDELFKEYVSENIAEWKTQYNESSHNFTEDEPYINLNFALSTVSIAELKEAFVNITINKTTVREVDDYVEEEIPAEELEKEAEQEKARKDQQEKESKKEKGQTENADQAEAVKEQAQQNIPEKQDTGEATPPEDNEQKTEESAESKDQEPAKPKTRLVKVKKSVESHKVESIKHILKPIESFNKYPLYTKDEIVEAQQILLKFQKHENELKEKSRIRNDLESTLYRLKEHFDDPFLTKFGQPEEVDALKKVVTEKLQWMDEHQWTATRDEFEVQYDEMYKAYEPIHNRSTEYSEREKTYNETVKFMSQTYQKTEALNKTHPWLTEMVDGHLKKINDTMAEIVEKLKRGVDLELNQNPTIYNHEMIKASEQLRDEYYVIKMIPRPKIPKPSTEKTEQKEEEGDNQNQEAQNEKVKIETEENQSGADSNEEEIIEGEEAQPESENSKAEQEEVKEDL